MPEPFNARMSLIGDEVRGGECDLVLALAGDREGPDHNVHLTGLQRGHALVRFEHPQIDAVRIAEDGARDLAGDVDVEALQLPRGRVAIAE